MIRDASLKTAARAHFEREAHRVANECNDLQMIDLQPARWVLSMLLTEHGHTPPQALNEVVRRRLNDMVFMDQGGDAVIDPKHQMPLDDQAQVVVKVLDRVTQAEDRGIPHRRARPELIAPALQCSQRVL